MIPAQSIDEVLEELDTIIEKSVQENNYLGIFAYIYRRTTAQIKTAIADKSFENNDRMEKFDVTFANFYLMAWQNYFNGGIVSNAWRAAFDARLEKLTVMQHLLMGMNAHINLDLGIAAEEIMPEDTIQDLKDDFMRVNGVLAGLVDEMQTKMARVSPLMFLLDWIGGRTEEKIINFSMAKAREYSWQNACRLSEMNKENKAEKISKMDSFVTDLSEIIKNPDFLILRLTLKFIRIFEVKNLSRMIAKLEEPVLSQNVNTKPE
jgi:hypothetical protein